MTKPRECQNCKKAFIVDADDNAFYQKLGVPPPTFCPDCRKQRRLTWRNDTVLYNRKCDLCNRGIVTIYPPDATFPVYCQKCWWGDGWDPKSYGQEYDFSKNFFLQFKELQSRVPVLAMVNDDGIASINCEYTQDFAFGKNCYMTFIAWKVENCLYNHYLINGREIVDAMNSMGDCEQTYETIYTEKCYRCRNIYYSVSLSDCSFCYDCRDCTDCFMCVNLRHKRYCFKNQQYSKEEYEKIVADYRLDTRAGVKRAASEFWPFAAQFPRRFATLRNCVSCTGDGLINGKNSKYCFNVQRPENCKWIENSDTPKDSYDLSVGGELEQCYEGITPDHSYQSRFAIFSWKNTDVSYVDGCHSSEHLFGCIGLKKGQYCILNRQYSKEEYTELVGRIKKQMDELPYADARGCVYKFGEFFPAELSYFAYNGSTAMDYFPLSREEVLGQGLRWQEVFQETRGRETLPLAALPESISDVKDDITKEVLACAECSRNYRIVPAELTFYHRMKVPVPDRCFYCRHKARFKLRNPFELYHRRCQCSGATAGIENLSRTSNLSPRTYSNTAEHFHGAGPCPNEFETPYAPDRSELVYCEQCYQAETA